MFIYDTVLVILLPLLKYYHNMLLSFPQVCITPTEFFKNLSITKYN